MFTGIITDTTHITKSEKTKDGLLVTFKKPAAWNDLILGESVATNGACLTVAGLRQGEYDCLLMPETLTKTSFGKNIPKSVNLERPMIASDRFGGHFVQGHVDCVGKVSGVNEDDGYRLTIDFPEQFSKLIIEKGSITVDGVSLTAIDVSENQFSVALIPHTLKSTTLGDLKPGDSVNLEFDILGKYIAKFNSNN